MGTEGIHRNYPSVRCVDGLYPKRLGASHTSCVQYSHTRPACNIHISICFSTKNARTNHISKSLLLTPPPLTTPHMAQELSLKQFSAELAGGFRKWSEQGQHPLAAFPTFISYIMDQHEYQRSLCKHIAQDGEMIKLGNTGVPVQHREEAQYVIASRLSEAQMFLHALEIHLICARKVNAYFVNGGHVGDRLQRVLSRWLS